MAHGQWHSLCRIQGPAKNVLAHGSLEGGTALIIAIVHLHACAPGRLAHGSDTGCSGRDVTGQGPSWRNSQCKGHMCENHCGEGNKWQTFGEVM